MTRETNMMQPHMKEIQKLYYLSNNFTQEIILLSYISKKKYYFVYHDRLIIDCPTKNDAFKFIFYYDNHCL